MAVQSCSTPPSNEDTSKEEENEEEEEEEQNAPLYDPAQPRLSLEWC